MPVGIASVNLNEKALIAGRQVVSVNYPRSVDVNTVDGSFLSTEPLLNDGSVIHYPQNPNNALYTTNTITNLPGYEALSFPLDAKFDTIRNKIWIADAGRSRIVSITSYDYSVIVTTENISIPYAVCPDTNTGGVFAIGFISTSQSRMTHINTDGTVVSSIYFSSSFPFADFIIVPNTTFIDAMPNTRSVAFDHTRSKVWWVSGTKVYTADTVSKTVSTYDLSAHAITDTLSIDIELTSGNAFITATDGSDWYIVQMLKGNNKYMGISWIE